MGIDIKAAVVAVVAFVVAIILVTCVLVPIINDSTSAEITRVNSGDRFALVSTENATTHTITAARTGNATTLALDTDTAIKMPKNNTPLIYGDDWMVMIYKNGNIEYIVGDGTGNKMLTPDTGDYSISMTISVPTGTFSATEYSASAFSDNDTIAYPNPTGTYVLTSRPYLLPDSTIYMAYYGQLNGTGGNTVTIGYIGTGSASTLASNVSEISPVSDPAYDITDSTVNVSINEISTVAVQLGSVSVVTEWDDSGTAKGTTTANVQYVLAPQTVTYENPNYDDNGAINAIIGIIPLLVVVGIVLGAITWVTMIKGKE